jgi:hypothetical protein
MVCSRGEKPGRRAVGRTMAGLGGVALALGIAITGARAEGAVTQYHADAARRGVFVTPEMTATRVAGAMRREPRFRTPVAGPVYAAPLFWTAPDGHKLVIVATEQNAVEALDAESGRRAWRSVVGRPAPPSSLPCGDISPMGITGTPVIDAGTIYFDAMVRRDREAPRQMIFALHASDGSAVPGWKVDVQAALAAEGQRFVAANQGQRGALAAAGGKIFVPYAGHFGDCELYRGWVVGVAMHDPAAVRGWATRARGGGIWAPAGIVSDGRALYVATGNTIGAGERFGDGEAVIRLGLEPGFSGRTEDFFAPANWRALDEADLDLGATNPTLAGGFVVALGKDGNAYLLERNNLGGIGGELLVKQVSATPIRSATATYVTGGVRYVVFQGEGVGCPGGRGGDLVALRIEAGPPPSITVAWCAQENGKGAPIVTTTDGREDPIVWAVGAEGDERLRAFRGGDGAVLFASVPMSLVRRFQTPIAADGRIYVAADQALYAFGF